MDLLINPWKLFPQYICRSGKLVSVVPYTQHRLNSHLLTHLHNPRVQGRPDWEALQELLGHWRRDQTPLSSARPARERNWSWWGHGSQDCYPRCARSKTAFASEDWKKNTIRMRICRVTIMTQSCDSLQTHRDSQHTSMWITVISCSPRATPMLSKLQRLTG